MRAIAKHRPGLGRPGTAVPPVPNPPPGGGSPFFDYRFSPFYTPIPADAPIWAGRSAPFVANSAGLVELLCAQIRNVGGVGGGITTQSAARPTFYVVDADTPLDYDVQIDNTSYVDDLRAEFAKGIPVPAGAHAGSGTGDYAMALWSPSMDTYWEFWQMAQQLHSPLLTSFSLTSGGSLAAGTYYYKFSAYNANGEGPTRANGMAASPNGSQKVALSWNDIQRATGYRIYRGTTPTDCFFLAEVTPHTIQTFTDDGSLTPDLGRRAPASDVNTATTPGQWACSLAGVAYNVSSSPGYFRNIQEDGVFTEKFTWGHSASSIFTQACEIQKGDLVRGVIDHVIGLALRNLAPGVVHPTCYAFPAQSTDGKAVDSRRIPYGTRFRWPYSDEEGELDFDTYDFGLTGMGERFARMFCKAVQRYGLMPREGTVGTSVYCENWLVYGDGFYTDGDTEHFYYDDGDSEPNFIAKYIPDQQNVFQSMPWERLVVPQMAICNIESKPCPKGGQI